MKWLQWDKVCGLACKQEKMWGVLVYNGIEEGPEFDDRYAIVENYFSSVWPKQIQGKPNPDFHSALNAFMSGDLILFTTKEEMDKFYWIFSQEPFDSSEVYACTFGPDGKCITENT